jgi:hypothetical protein
MGTHRTTVSTKAKTALWSLGAATAAVALAVGAGAASGAPGLDIPGISTPAIAGVTSTVVTEKETKDFRGTDDRGAGARTFTEEYGGAAGSKGALKLVTPDTGDKITFFHPGAAAKLSGFAEKLGYSAYKDSVSTGSDIQFPSLQLVIDFNGPDVTGGFSTLFFEPYYQTGSNNNLAENQWNTYDAAAGVFCSTKVMPAFETAGQTFCGGDGTKTLAAIVEANPDATVTDFGFNQGSGNPGIIAAVDQLVTPEATYDFEENEPIVPPVTTDPTPKPDPGNGGGNNGGGHGNNGGGNNGGGHGNNGGGNNGGGHGPGKGGDCRCG